ncbi:hypothetical protein DCC79_15135, partial [bacterium]
MSINTRLAAAGLAVATLAAAAPVGAAPLHETMYTVASGDTLGAIGTRCGVSWQKIAAANGIANPSRLKVGQSLKVPGSSGCKARAAAPAAAPAAANPAPAAAPAQD